MGAQSAAFDTRTVGTTARAVTAGLTWTGNAWGRGRRWRRRAVRARSSWRGTSERVRYGTAGGAAIL